MESDPISAKLCADDFLHSGYYIEILTEGASAVSAIERLKPHAVVVSYFLQDLDASEVLKRIREKPAIEAVPVVVLIPPHRPEILSAARKAGAHRCIVKDRGWDGELRKAVREILTAGVPPREPSRKADTPTEPPAEVLREEVAPAPPSPAPKASPPPTLAAPPPPPSGGPSIERLKELSIALLKSEETPLQIALVTELYEQAGSLLGNLPTGKKDLITAMAGAFLGLLQELTERPANISPSTMRTVFQTVQSLAPRVADPAAAALGPIERFAVLAVDDEAPIRRLVTRALDSIHLKVETASDPLEAIEQAGKRAWDLFLLDVNMPKMNGFELCGKLRSLPSHRKTPVVFLTGCNDIEHRIRFARTKADDFIAKPFLISELVVKVLGHLLNVAAKRDSSAKAESSVFRRFGQ